MPPQPAINLPNASPVANIGEIPVGDEQETGERDGEIDVVEEEGE
jgi:hypothetical protein